MKTSSDQQKFKKILESPIFKDYAIYLMNSFVDKKEIEEKMKKIF